MRWQKTDRYERKTFHIYKRSQAGFEPMLSGQTPQPKCYQRHTSSPSLCFPPHPPPPLHLRDSSSEGHQKINELITDRGNVSDTAPSCLPPPIMIIIFSYLRSGCLSQQDIPNESGGHTCLSPFIFLITLLSFIPVIIWKSHYSKSGYHEGFWDPAQYEVCLGNVRSAVFMQEQFLVLQTFKNSLFKPSNLNGCLMPAEPPK